MKSIKLYAGIDYQFRPESYWAAAANPLEAALRNVKGRNRREMIKDYHKAGVLEQLDEDLLADLTRGPLDCISMIQLDSEHSPALGKSGLRRKKDPLVFSNSQPLAGSCLPFTREQQGAKPLHLETQLAH